MSHVAPSRLPRLLTFVGADQGRWAVRSARTFMGDALPPAPCLQVVAGAAVPSPRDAAWALAGITSNDRYGERDEKVALVGAQAGLGRTEASRAQAPDRQREEAHRLLPRVIDVRRSGH